MNEEMPDDFRQIYAIVGKGHGPRKIIMDVYEDGYTPFDVISALVCFTLESQEITERFRAYIQDDADARTFTGEEAEEHLHVLLRLLITVWETVEGSSVYVTGSRGWVN